MGVGDVNRGVIARREIHPKSLAKFRDTDCWSNSQTDINAGAALMMIFLIESALSMYAQIGDDPPEEFSRGASLMLSAARQSITISASPVGL